MAHKLICKAQNHTSNMEDEPVQKGLKTTQKWGGGLWELGIVGVWFLRGFSPPFSLTS